MFPCSKEHSIRAYLYTVYLNDLTRTSADRKIHRQVDKVRKLYVDYFLKEAIRYNATTKAGSPQNVIEKLQN